MIKIPRVIVFVLYSMLWLAVAIGFHYGHSQRWFADVGHSGWVVKQGRQYQILPLLELENPQQARVMIYNHGNNSGRLIHQCNPVVPPSVLFLQNYGVHLYYLCSRTTEPLLSFILPGRFGLQVFSRVAEVEAVVDQLLAQGIRPEHIYLSGQSQGGWVSMMSASRFAEKVHAAVAFAPGFGGGKRDTAVRTFRMKSFPYQKTEMLKGPNLNALIFSYDNDSYTRPDELRFLVEHYGEQVSLVHYDCGLAESHFTAYHDCRLEQTKQLILNKLGLGAENAEGFALTFKE